MRLHDKYRLIWLALAALIAATRITHFGGTVRLPDASYAAFFATGMLALPALGALGLALVAAGVDLISLSHGADPFCFTLAYPLLFVAYAALWAIGRAAQNVRPLRVLLLGALAAAIGFGISNAGFYLFSGRFPNLSLVEYGTRVAGYLPRYVAVMTAYLLPLVLVRGFRAARVAQRGQLGGHDSSVD